MGTCLALTLVIIVQVCHVVGRGQVASGDGLDGHLRFHRNAVLPEAEDEGLVGFLVLVSCPAAPCRWRRASPSG